MGHRQPRQPPVLVLQIQLPLALQSRLVRQEEEVVMGV